MAVTAIALRAGESRAPAREQATQRNPELKKNSRPRAIQMDMEKSAAEESYGAGSALSSAWVLTSLSAQEERAGDFVSCDGRREIFSNTCLFVTCEL